MREKIARALGEKCLELRGHGLAFASEYVAAVLDALREPTEAMIEAGCEARNMVPATQWTDGTTDGVQSIERMLAERSFTSMIDAAKNGA